MKRLAYKLAVTAAKNSPSRFRVGSVIYCGSRIIGVGSNEMSRTHPKSPHPFLAVHAEFMAVINASRHGNNYLNGVEFLRGMDIYTHRLKKDGSTGLAAPCPHCFKMLRGLGIRRINYSREG